MKNKANIIVLVVVGVLIAITLVLVVGSGACSPSGGGGAASSMSGGAMSSNASAGNSGGYDYSPVSGADRDMSVEEFERLLDSSSAPTGANARSAASSANVPATSEVYQQLSQRSFGEVKLEADFDLSGNSMQSGGLDASSPEKYPSYTGAYQSSTGVLWLLYVNDGSYYAVPLGSSGKALSKNIILSETDAVVQYDAGKNEFSDFNLNQVPDTVCVKVDHIDKSTLDSYALDALERA